MTTIQHWEALMLSATPAANDAYWITGLRSDPTVSLVGDTPIR